MNTYEIEVSIIKDGEVSFKAVSVQAKSRTTAKIMAVRIVRDSESCKTIVQAH